MLIANEVAISDLSKTCSALQSWIWYYVKLNQFIFLTYVIFGTNANVPKILMAILNRILIITIYGIMDDNLYLLLLLLNPFSWRFSFFMGTAMEVYEPLSWLFIRNINCYIVLKVFFSLKCWELVKSTFTIWIILQIIG